jgi:cytochrome c biogenesis protein CcmG, thiol:disulfide interchange protein DsbE
MRIGLLYLVVRFLVPTILLSTLLLVACNTGPHPRLIGSKAPDFTVKDSDRSVSLHDLRGKPVVLNFWASYCPPCIKEMPSLTELQQEMGSRVTVLAVSVDEEEANYHKFLRDHNIHLLTVWDPTKKSMDLYGTVQLPETYIIDASGTVRRKMWNAVDFTSPDVIEYLSKL